MNFFAYYGEPVLHKLHKMCKYEFCISTLCYTVFQIVLRNHVVNESECPLCATEVGRTTFFL
jgi:hypothetical protein